MRFFFRGIFFFFLSYFPSGVLAGDLNLKIISNYELPEELKNLTHEKSFSDSIDLHKALTKFIFRANEIGFLEANFDSLKKDSLNFYAYFTLGRKMELRLLDLSDVEPYYLDKAGIRNKTLDRKKINVLGIGRIQEKLLNILENSGYPFAEVFLSNIVSTRDSFSASVLINKNYLIIIDSIIIKGNAEVSRNYLSQYTGIKQGDIYNESKIKLLEKNLKELSFINVTASPGVEFVGEKAHVYLFLDKKEASQFDGVAGFLPDSKTGKVKITGDLKLRLLNSLHKAETIELNWRRTQVNTQEIQAGLILPAMFGSPFGLDGGIRLYRKDTSFADFFLNVGVQYLLSAGKQIKIFTTRKNSWLISPSAYKNSTTLPEFADINLTSYGLEFKNEKLDYRFNPRRGFRYLISGSAGKRFIKINKELNPDVYKDLEIKTTQFSSNLYFDLFIPLFKRNTLLTGIKSSFISGKQIFQNELLRMGGFRTLRGFDEESLWTNGYLIFTNEFRILTDENSNLFVFFDQGYYQYKKNKKTLEDHPFGFGTGINFETRAGIFSLSYALGKQLNNPLLLRSAKIHFGLVNYF